MTLACATVVLSSQGSGRALLRAVAVSTLLASVGVACGGAPAQAITPESKTVGEPSVATEPATEQAATAPRRLAKGESWTFSQANLLVRGPDRSFDADTARRQFVEPKRAPASEGDIWVVIDRGNPRPLVGRQPVTRLLDETLELAPGEHRLVAYRSLSSERVVEYEVRSFSVDVEPASVDGASRGGTGAEAQDTATSQGRREAAGPDGSREADPAAPGGEMGCILLRPRGTYNGEDAADALQVLALPLAARIDRFAYRLGGEVLEAPAGQAVLVSSLPSGDHVFSLECGTQEGGEVERISRTVTVNRDQAPELE